MKVLALGSQHGGNLDDIKINIGGLGLAKDSYRDAVYIDGPAEVSIYYPYTSQHAWFSYEINESAIAD